MKSRPLFVLLMFGIIVFSSLLPIAEIWILQMLGVDVIAHLKITVEEGGWSLYLEAFGFAAFVLVHPIISVWLLIRLANRFRTWMLTTLTMMLGR